MPYRIVKRINLKIIVNRILKIKMKMKMMKMKKFKMIQMLKKMRRISTSKLSTLHLKINRISKLGLKISRISLLTSRWLRNSKTKPSSL